MASKATKTTENHSGNDTVSSGDIMSKLPTMDYAALVALAAKIQEETAGKKDQALAGMRAKYQEFLGKLTQEGEALGFTIDDIMGTTVAAKYRNPANASETWSGRGRKPKWLEAQLALGAKVEDFLISKEHDEEDEKAAA
jgi:DNA-binding protein H-NS